jgi:hypothetical protein
MASRSLRTKVTAQAEQVLEKLAREHLMGSNAIVFMDNEIMAFGRYTIRREKSRYQVYRYKQLAAEPYSSRVAISWCVADKYNQTRLAKELINLETELERRENEIDHFKSFLKRTKDQQKKLVIMDRLHESIMRSRQVKDQLNKCINSAKYWQQKGFENETVRTGLKKQSSAK